MTREFLPIQNDSPETVFIFGAGSCYPDGVPLQQDIVPTILNDSDPQLCKSDSCILVRSFLRENFSYKDKYPSLEEVFGFVEFFLSNEMGLSFEYDNATLYQIKRTLTRVIHYIISKSTRENSSNFSLFWKAVKAKNKNIGIITTNYDTLVDSSFDLIYPDCLIDYCIDFMNYRYPNVLPAFNWWVDPKKPGPVFNGIVPTRIKLIKVHGSLSWKYCNCCGQVALTPRQHQVNLKLDSFEAFLGSELSCCPLDNNKFSSLIQAPSHIKSNLNHIFSKLYDEAAFLIRGAKRLIFIGYSFPEADVHIRALIRKSFNQKGTITVVNKSRARNCDTVMSPWPETLNIMKCLLSVLSNLEFFTMHWKQLTIDSSRFSISFATRKRDESYHLN